MKKIIRLLPLLVLLISLISCGKFHKIQKSDDWKVKYEAAIAYYEKADYRHATTLLESIIPIIRGTQEAELASFYLSYCYYYQKQYLLSANHFNEFVRIYGRSDYVLEASYRYAHSLYLQSPKYQLDQTVTYEAIAAMQNFLNTHPTTDYAIEGDKIIDFMQQKLEKKAYEQCQLYYKLRRYKASLVVYDNFAKDFTDSKYNEEIAFFKIETSHSLARESIRTKQKERFQNTIDHYLTFLDKYPNSSFLKSAEKFYIDSIKKMTKFAQIN